MQRYGEPALGVPHLVLEPAEGRRRRVLVAPHEGRRQRSFGVHDQRSRLLDQKHLLGHQWSAKEDTVAHEADDGRDRPGERRDSGKGREHEQNQQHGSLPAHGYFRTLTTNGLPLMPTPFMVIVITSVPVNIGV